MTVDEYDDETGTLPPRRTPAGRRRRLLAVVAGLAGVAGVATLVAVTVTGPPAGTPGAGRGSASAPRTATVARRVLTSTLVVAGTVTPEITVDVTAVAAPGTLRLVVTALRTAPGDSVRPGQVLVEVSGRPIIALAGAVPAYRDLTPDSDGPDVATLQRALRALGHSTGADATGHFGAGTKIAVSRLYAALGYDVPTTGGHRDAADQPALQAAQEAVTKAARQRDAAQAALADATARSDPGAAASAQTVLAQAQQDLTRTQQSQAALVARTGPMLPLAEFVFVPKFPVQVAMLAAGVGDPVAAPLLTLRGGALRVRAVLPPTSTEPYTVGMAASIDAATGTPVPASVTSVGPLLTPSLAGTAGGGGDGTGADPAVAASGYPVAVTPDSALDPSWAGREVRLSVRAGSTDGAVLVVPLTAVSTGGDGRGVVTVLDPTGRTRAVPVRPGLAGDGVTEVTPVDGASLNPGDTVLLGS